MCFKLRCSKAVSTAYSLRSGGQMSSAGSARGHTPFEQVVGDVEDD